jgi:hypothetical protein
MRNAFPRFLSAFPRRCPSVPASPSAAPPQRIGSESAVSSQTGGSGRFALEFATVWNFLGLAPETSRSVSILAAVALLCGAAACGPSNGGGTPATYVIEFTLSDTPDDDDLTALGLDIAYDVGNFTGTGEDVACGLVTGVGDSAVFDDDNAGTLKVDIVATTDELVEDEVLFTCDFVSNEQPTAADFTITIRSSAPSDEEDVSVAITCTELEGVECE